MLGPQWSKEELQRFYEAYRKYGKDWKKVRAKPYLSLHICCMQSYIFVSVYILWMFTISRYLLGHILLHMGRRASLCTDAFLLVICIILQFHEVNSTFFLFYLGPKVAATVRNRSVEMVEALYTMNRVRMGCICIRTFISLFTTLLAPCLSIGFFSVAVSLSLSEYPLMLRNFCFAILNFTTITTRLFMFCHCHENGWLHIYLQKKHVSSITGMTKCFQ